MISISNSDYALLVSVAEAYVSLPPSDNLAEFNRMRRAKILLKKFRRKKNER